MAVAEIDHLTVAYGRVCRLGRLHASTPRRVRGVVGSERGGQDDVFEDGSGFY